MPFSAGNELAAGANSVSGDRTVEEMIGNFQTLAKMIDEIWSDTPAAERPKIIGPSEQPVPPPSPSQISAVGAYCLTWLRVTPARLPLE